MLSMKTLLASAVLALSIPFACLSQPVYSANVVGWSMCAFVPGFNLLCNPLDSTDNRLSHILSGPQVPDNTQVLIWDSSIQDFSATSPSYVAATHAWVPDMDLLPGEGVFILAFEPFTNTFVGQVRQGVTVIPLAPGYNAISSPAPIGGDVNRVLVGLPANDNDQALLFDQGAQDFVNSSTYVAATHTWVPPMNVGVNDGLFYLNFGNSTTWVRNFTVH
jgi:hypothetical protein